MLVALSGLLLPVLPGSQGTELISIGPATVRDATWVAAHMRAADYHEIDAVVPLDQPVAVACWLLAASQGMAWCASIDGQPVTIFGCTTSPITPHLASGWAYGTRDLKRTIPEVTRFALGVVRPELLSRGITRLEVRTYIDHDLSHRWLEGMGFEREGISRAYGRRGEDFAVYAATRNV